MGLRNKGSTARGKRGNRQDSSEEMAPQEWPYVLWIFHKLFRDALACLNLFYSPHPIFSKAFFSDAMMWLTKLYFRFVLNAFYRSILVVNEATVPLERDTPVILIGNHQNQFIDGIMMFSHCRRNIGFLIAEKSMHRPIIRAFSRLLHLIPVVRPQDRQVKGKGFVTSIVGDTLTTTPEASLSTAVNPGDSIVFRVGGVEFSVPVYEVTSDTQCTLKAPWPHFLPESAPAVVAAAAEAAEDAKDAVFPMAECASPKRLAAAAAATAKGSAPSSASAGRSQLAAVGGGEAGVEAGVGSGEESGAGARAERAQTADPSRETLATALEKDVRTTATRPHTSPNIRGVLGVAFQVRPRIDHGKMYRSVSSVLNAGGTVGVFPEGGSHDQPMLLPLKAGVAIFALSAAVEAAASGSGVKPPVIVPCGLTYLHGHRFRSRAVMEYGEPISIPDSLVKLAADRATKGEAVEQLMSMLQEALFAVTVNVPTVEQRSLIFEASRLYLGDYEWKIPPADLLRFRRRFSEGLLKATRLGREDVKQLFDSLAEYAAQRRALSLTDPLVRKLAPLCLDAGADGGGSGASTPPLAGSASEQLPSPATSQASQTSHPSSRFGTHALPPASVGQARSRIRVLLIYHLIRIAVYAILGLPCLLAVPVGILAHAWSGTQTRKAVASSTVKLKGHDVSATYKVICGMVGMPVIFTLYCAAVASAVSLRAGIVLFIILPFLMWFSLQYATAVRMRWRSFWPLLKALAADSYMRDVTLLCQRRRELARMVRQLVAEVGPTLDGGNFWSPRSQSLLENVSRLSTPMSGDAAGSPSSPTVPTVVGPSGTASLEVEDPYCATSPQQTVRAPAPGDVGAAGQRSGKGGVGGPSEGTAASPNHKIRSLLRGVGVGLRTWQSKSTLHLDAEAEGEGGDTEVDDVTATAPGSSARGAPFALPNSAQRAVGGAGRGGALASFSAKAAFEGLRGSPSSSRRGSAAAGGAAGRAGREGEGDRAESVGSVGGRSSGALGRSFTQAGLDLMAQNLVFEDDSEWSDDDLYVVKA